AERETREADAEALDGGDALEDARALAHDLGSDSIARDHGDLVGLRHGATPPASRHTRNGLWDSKGTRGSLAARAHGRPVARSRRREEPTAQRGRRPVSGAA